METKVKSNQKTLQTTYHVLSHLLPLFLGLVLQSGIPPTSPNEAIEEHCIATFSASNEWQSNHPGCQAMVYLTDCGIPTLTVSGSECLPLETNTILGIIDVYNGAELQFRYQVRSVNGSVIIILIDDF